MKTTALALAIATILTASTASAFPGLTALWNHRHGNALQQQPFGIVLDASGNAIVFGWYEGTLDFGLGAMTSVGGFDGFVAKIAPNGTALWNFSYGSALTDIASAAAVDAAGNIIVTGGLNNQLFVKKYDTNGNVQWTRDGGVNGNHQGMSVAVDAAGNIYCAGLFLGEVDLGGGYMSTAGVEMWFAKLTSAGAHVFSKQFGDGNTVHPRRIALDKFGRPVVACEMFGAINFGGGNLTGIEDGSTDIALVQFTAAGGWLWNRRFSAAGYDVVAGMEIDKDGSIILAGTYHHPLDFGGGALPIEDGSGNPNVYLVKLSPYGNHQWSHGYGDSQPQNCTSLDVLPNGDIVLSGQFRSNPVIGGVTFNMVGTGDNFFAIRLNGRNQQALWTAQITGDGYPSAFVAVSGDEVAMVGSFSGQANWGGSTLTSSGETDVVLARYEEPALATPVGPAASLTTLDQNVPNPFNPSTSIAFTLSTPGRAAIGIYDVNGARVRTLDAGEVGAGAHTVRWDGRDDAGQPVASGTYFYRIEGATGAMPRKMLLVK